jgi:hypothetical protein
LVDEAAVVIALIDLLQPVQLVNEVNIGEEQYVKEE